MQFFALLRFLFFSICERSLFLDFSRSFGQNPYLIFLPSSLFSCAGIKVRGFPPLLNHLGDKADFTPSPLLRSGSNRGCLTGETNDFVRCYGFAHAEQASVTLLMSRRNHCSPNFFLEWS